MVSGAIAMQEIMPLIIAIQIFNLLNFVNCENGF